LYFKHELTGQNFFFEGLLGEYVAGNVFTIATSVPLVDQGMYTLQVHMQRHMTDHFATSSIQALQTGASQYVVFGVGNIDDYPLTVLPYDGSIGEEADCNVNFLGDDF